MCVHVSPLYCKPSVSVWCAERVLSVLEARVNVCRGESLRRLEFAFCATQAKRKPPRSLPLLTLRCCSRSPRAELLKREVDALGVITISRWGFERCCSNKTTPPYPHANLSFVRLRNRRPTLLSASAYRTPSEARPRRRCGHARLFFLEDG